MSQQYSFDPFALGMDGIEGAKQSHKDECDINNILRGYARTGTVAHVAAHGGEYGFASATSFHEAMNILAKAKEMFSGLPATVRKRFGNDPANFLEFVQDEKNLDAMREMGLANPALEREATLQDVVDAVQASSGGSGGGAPGGGDQPPGES